jgi:hypothetical protein
MQELHVTDIADKNEDDLNNKKDEIKKDVEA